METRTIKGTTTEHNLMAAFAGESQDFARYTIYAEAARTEGYEQIGRAFDDVARQELAHSRLLLSRLEGGDIRIASSYRADIAGNSLEKPLPRSRQRTRRVERHICQLRIDSPRRRL